MQRLTLITIIIVVVIVVIVGGFALTANSRRGAVVPPANEGQQQTQQDQTTTTGQKTSFIQGMKIEIVKEGSGVEAKSGDAVTVHYTGTLQDGKKFDSSVDRNAPFSFVLGKGTVIKGWDLGVAGMKVGEVRMLTIPPELGYGAGGYPPIIPQNATLTFKVEMLKIGK